MMKKWRNKKQRKKYHDTRRHALVRFAMRIGIRKEVYASPKDYAKMTNLIQQGEGPSCIYIREGDTGGSMFAIKYTFKQAYSSKHTKTLWVCAVYDEGLIKTFLGEDELTPEQKGRFVELTGETP